MNELISIVIPVYNVEKYLDACMKSVLRQTYRNLEIILVDDGATDKSGQMCDRYAETDLRVTVVHKENGGLSDARNKGISHAKGKYIMFIDSDDVVSLDFVEYLYKLLKGNSADIAICDPVHCYPDKEIVFERENRKKIMEAEDAIIEMLYQKSFLVAAWGKIYKKEYFDETTFPYGMLFEDSAVMYKIFDKAEKIVYGNAKLYGYMHRDGSITTQTFTMRDTDILTISNQMVEYMSDRSTKMQKAARAYQMNAHMRVYLNAPQINKWDQVVRVCRTFIKRNWLPVFTDIHIRRKLRASLILFRFGKRFMRNVYAHVERWS